MKRYLVKALRVQEVSMMVCAHDEDDAFDQALKYQSDFDIEFTRTIDEVEEITDVTNDIDYQEDYE